MTSRAASRPVQAFPPGGDPILPSRSAAVSLLAIIALVVTGAAAPKPASQPAPYAAAPADVDKAGHFIGADYVIGDPKAPVTVVEYLSDTCSHCAYFDAHVWPATKAKFVDSGKVKWVVREFVTEPVVVSAAGFVLARCAGKARYFDVIEQIFRAQPEMITKNDWKGPFLRIAKGAGLTEDQFKACLSDDKAFDAVNARVDRAQTVDNIDGTPTLFINGKKAFDSVPTVEELDKALTAARAR